MARGYSPGAQEDVGHGCMKTCEKKRLSKYHRLVGSRWVFKVKQNRVYCARLVEKVSAKSWECISQTIIPQWLMMSHSELWWEECLLKFEGESSRH